MPPDLIHKPVEAAEKILDERLLLIERERLPDSCIACYFYDVVHEILEKISHCRHRPPLPVQTVSKSSARARPLDLTARCCGKKNIGSGNLSLGKAECPMQRSFGVDEDVVR